MPTQLTRSKRVARNIRFLYASINWIQASFLLRQSGDYDSEADIFTEEAQQSLDYARRFYALPKAYLDEVKVNHQFLNIEAVQIFFVS